MKRIFKHEPGPRRIAGDVDEELAFHIQERTEKLIAAGMPADAARAEALRQFGDLGDVRDSCVTLDRDKDREARRSRWFDELRQDLTYAWRSTRRNPGFSLVVVLTLALGIGANTAIFTLVDAVLLRKLPVRDPDQLFAIGNPIRVNSLSVSDHQRTDIMSYPQYKEIRDHARSFSGVLASGRGGRLDVYLGEPNGEPEHPSARFVSGNYFTVLGVPAMLGRTLRRLRRPRRPGTADRGHQSPVLDPQACCGSIGRRTDHPGEWSAAHHHRGDSAGISRRDRGILHRYLASPHPPAGAQPYQPMLEDMHVPVVPAPRAPARSGVGVAGHGGDDHPAPELDPGENATQG